MSRGHLSWESIVPEGYYSGEIIWGQFSQAGIVRVQLPRGYCPGGELSQLGIVQRKMSRRHLSQVSIVWGAVVWWAIVQGTIVLGATVQGELPCSPLYCKDMAEPYYLRRIGAFENLAKFTGIKLCWRHFLIELHRCFPMISVKFSTPIFQSTRQNQTTLLRNWYFQDTFRS